MAQQGTSHPHPPKGWDRLVNPVQDLGRSLLNFLVGGSSSTTTLTSESQQNAAHQLDNSIAHSMCVDGHKEEKTNIRVTFDATAPRSTPIILKRTPQTVNSGGDNSVNEGQILNNSLSVSTNKTSSLRFSSTVQIKFPVSPDLFVNAIGLRQLKYLLLGKIITSVFQIVSYFYLYYDYQILNRCRFDLIPFEIIVLQIPMDVILIW